MVASSNRELGSGQVLCYVILSTTHFYTLWTEQQMMMPEDEIHSHLCDQALKTHLCGRFGLFCFSITSFVSTVKQKLSAIISCPLSFISSESHPPASSSCMISSASVLSLQKLSHVAIWLSAPEQTGVSADLGIFVPWCGMQYKTYAPAEMLCWIERRLAIFGSRYHNRVKMSKILLQFYLFPETSLSVRFGSLLAIFSWIMENMFYM